MDRIPQRMPQRAPPQTRNERPSILASLVSNKHRVLVCFVIALVITLVMVLFHAPAPLLIKGLDPAYNGQYADIGDGWWIAIGGENGGMPDTYYKINAESYASGLDASSFQVHPAGFPFQCAFVDDLFSKGFGIYLFDIVMFLVDLIIFFVLIFVVARKFDLFTGEPKEKRTKY